MKALFVPDFMYEVVFWGVKWIDMMLIVTIAFAIRRTVQFVQWRIWFNDSGEWEK